MKKICTLLATAFIATSSFGQTLDNAGMETWRTGTAGTGPVLPITAPTQWFGFDSLVIAAGEAFGIIIGAGDEWKQQIFQENTLVHGGSAAARCVTVEQDVLGYVPGMLSNAKPVFDAGVLAGGGSPEDAVTFEGGTPTTLRITSASAWVAYFPGKDETTGMFGGPDKGVMNVQAIATVAGEDSVVGMGSVNISASAAYVQVTAPVTYTTTAYNVHTFRVTFASGGGEGAALDSSVLLVDDVTAVGEVQSVKNVAYNSNVVKVYPNPSKGFIYLNSPVRGAYTCTVASVAGQVVATKELLGVDRMDLSAQPTGLYVYTITDTYGAVVQSGKVHLEN